MADSQPDEAIAELQAYARLEPEDARPFAAMGAVYLNSSRVDQAVDAFGMATRLDPKNAAYRSALGQALLVQPGRVRDASAAFEEALRLKPTQEGAFSGVAYSAGLAEAWQEEVRKLDDEARQKAGSANAQVVAGLARAYSGELENGQREIQHVLASQPQNGHAHYALARVKYLLGDYATADAELRLAQANGATPSLTFVNAVKRKLGP
jgi:cytochrome c-type biogenesis protein CcmH/NrfG